jgi:hypothetical protein
MGYRFFVAPRQQCGLITDLEPAFRDRLRALVALRRRHANVLLRGTFLDTVPLGGATRGLVARAFESDAGTAAAVWNPTAAAQELDLTWGGRAPREVVLPDGSARGAGRPLPAGEVAVLLFGNPGSRVPRKTLSKAGTSA